MDAQTAGKQEWIDVLRDRYGSATAAADVYGLDVDDWHDLEGTTGWFDPADDDRVRDDLLTLMKRVAERWYGLHHEYIRTFDDKHLLLGDKQNFVPEWLMEFLKAYVDVTVIQKYEPFEAHREKTRTLYEETGNPIINGDGSFSVVRSEQSTQGCKGYHLDTGEAVGEAYASYLEESLAEPYMLGWHHCGMLEQWDSSGRGDIATSETGFLDPFENEYESITERIKSANERAEQWHESATADGGVTDE